MCKIHIHLLYFRCKIWSGSQDKGGVSHLVLLNNVKQEVRVEKFGIQMCRIYIYYCLDLVHSKIFEPCAAQDCVFPG